jgi:periplasmic protein CpxP/Spy
MTRSNCLVSVAAAALLMLPAAAFAQTAAPAAPTPPAPAATSSPLTSHPVPGANAEQRVEQHIRELHAQLRITPAEEPQWQQFANVMRENARSMDQEFSQRMQQFPTMTALQNMQSYQRLADLHAQDMGKLVPAFADLYNAMPEQQKLVTDRVFRANAEANTQHRMQTGRNEAR